MADRGLKSLADFDSSGSSDVEAHLTDLVVDGDVVISTQNQAFSGLLFLFQHVLHPFSARERGWGYGCHALSIEAFGLDRLNISRNRLFSVRLFKNGKPHAEP